MKKEKSNNLKKIGNENSYTKDFLESLYKKIDLKDARARADLERTIILATQAYEC